MTWKFWAFIDFLELFAFFSLIKLVQKLHFRGGKKTFSTVDDITFKGLGK